MDVSPSSRAESRGPYRAPKSPAKTRNLSSSTKIVDLPTFDPEISEEDLSRLLERLPPFNQDKLTDEILRKILKHLLPYDRRKILDDTLYKILTYISDTDPIYHPNLLTCSLDPKELRLSIPRRLLHACPRVPLRVLVNFSHVNYAVKLANEKRLSQISAFHNDILELILNHLSPNSGEDGKLLKPNDKATLSVESFASNPPPQLVDDYSNINSFSQVCKRFLDPARKRLFVRVTARFSSEDFEKLRNIAERPLFASSVKKFSYKIPRFYSQDPDQFQKLLKAFNENSQTLLMQHIERGRNQPRRELRLTASNRALIEEVRRRAEDQRKILGQRIDEDCLFDTLSRFTNLQQVRLMRVQDPIDTRWIRFLANYPTFSDEFRADDWTQSCEHAAKTLSWVLMRSKNRDLTRFSSRFMEPSSPLVISQPLRSTISALAARLLYLELEFVDERSHRYERMLELSELFKTVLSAARNLQCLHVGFRHRISAPLALLFHDIRFTRLQHIGLHMWDLDTDELIELLQRHRSKLRSIRLRNITLKQNTPNEKNWEKVLRFIRSTFPKLEWISLRRASYDSSTSAVTHAMGGLHFAPALHQYLPYMEDDSDIDSVESNWHGVRTEGDLDTDEESSRLAESNSGSSNGQNDAHGLDDLVAGNQQDSGDDGSAISNLPPQGIEDNVEANEDDLQHAESYGFADGQHDMSDSASSVSGNQEDNDHDNNDTDLDEDDHNLSFGHSFPAEDELQANRYPYAGADTEAKCECGGDYGWDIPNPAYRDDGISVNREKWKFWQEWVCKSCSIHDPRDTQG